MEDMTLGLEGVEKRHNSKKLDFDSPRHCWFWVVAYCKKNKYKLRLSKPLSKKIYDQLRGVISPKAVSSRDLYNAVGFHVNSIKYLKRMYPGVERLNLWGKSDGKVTAQEAQYAKQKLAEMHPDFIRAKRKSKKQGIIVNNKGKKPQGSGTTTGGRRKLTLGDRK